MRSVFLTAVLPLLAAASDVVSSPPGTYTPASEPQSQVQPPKEVFRFPGVYCLSFPAGASAELQEQYFSNGAVYLVRAEYPPRTMLNIVASTVPAGREPEAELDRLLGIEKQLEAGYNTNYHLSVTRVGSTRVIHGKIYDVAPGGNGGPFPLVRALFKNDGTPPISVSAHRLFVRGSNRFEVAAYHQFAAEAGSEEVAAAEKTLAALVDGATQSLLDCSEPATGEH